MNPTMTGASVHVTPDQVHSTLAKHMLADGFDFVLDLDKSQGVWLHDSRGNKTLMDFFSFFASNPVGMNHPGVKNPEFQARLLKAAVHNVTNSDVYTTEMAEFVETFARHAMKDTFAHSFFVAGGTLGIENALKAAFDWKVRKNFARGYREERGTKVLHFEQAFHGRSGYTLSLTNTTDPRKVAYFPKFDWPRVVNPKVEFPLNEDRLKEVKAREALAVAQMERVFEQNPGDIAAIIIEPIQGEGGDNHFRPEFFKELRRLADQNDAMLVFDEVQAGFGLTGKFWSFEHYGVTPDMVGFGKKSQICGFISTKRIDEVQDNVFHVSSRINSTWGGTLVDMVRSQRYLEIMAEEKLLENATARGAELLAGLEGLVKEFPEHVMNARGKGMMCAFDLRDGALRDQVISNAYGEGVVVLGCGPTSIRFRPPLVITKDEIAQGLEKFRTSIKKALSGRL
ncbi:MAG TPA: L-lysine 6-transaminase [Candidatus Eisenbacteria bacterium]|nr:L-lysine 6-transaminase [Candidatus Eisenbacteria bacterium]